MVWESVGVMVLCVLILGESIEVLHGVVITHFMLLGTFIFVQDSEQIVFRFNTCT